MSVKVFDVDLVNLVRRLAMVYDGILSDLP